MGQVLLHVNILASGHLCVKCFRGSLPLSFHLGLVGFLRSSMADIAEKYLAVW